MNVSRGKLAVGLFTVAAVLGLAGTVEGQSMSLWDDWLEIKDSSGRQQTLLEPAYLRLGGPAGNGVDGGIELFDEDSNAIFLADAANRWVVAQLDFWVLAPSGSSTIHLDGESGKIGLGGFDNDGDLLLTDSSLSPTIVLDGDTGSAETSLDGNGFVKGWARIGSDGVVLSCYNCNPDPRFTGKLALGLYYVDFGPIANDISSRPRFVTLDRHGTSQAIVDRVTLDDDDTGDPSRIKVITGEAQDHSFTITVF